MIIGPNGAGKTTFMDLVTGKTAPSFGRVFFDGADITGKCASEIAKKYKIGRKFQGPNVFDNMTVKENIEIAAEGYESLLRCLLFRRTKAFGERVQRGAPLHRTVRIPPLSGLRPFPRAAAVAGDRHGVRAEPAPDHPGRADRGHDRRRNPKDRRDDQAAQGRPYPDRGGARYGLRAPGGGVRDRAQLRHSFWPKARWKKCSKTPK